MPIKKVYFKNGFQESEEFYENNKITGNSKYFYENGKPKTIMSMSNGIVTIMNYDSNGKIRRKEKYWNGSIIELIDF